MILSEFLMIVIEKIKEKNSWGKNELISLLQQTAFELLASKMKGGE